MRHDSTIVMSINETWLYHCYVYKQLYHCYVYKWDMTTIFVYVYKWDMTLLLLCL